MTYSDQKTKQLPEKLQELPGEMMGSLCKWLFYLKALFTLPQKRGRRGLLLAYYHPCVLKLIQTLASLAQKSGRTCRQETDFFKGFIVVSQEIRQLLDKNIKQNDQNANKENNQTEWGKNNKGSKIHLLTIFELNILK